MPVIQTWGEEAVEAEVPQAEVEAAEAFESAFEEESETEADESETEVPETETDADDPNDPPGDDHLEASESEPEPESEPETRQEVDSDRGRDDLLIQIWNAELRCRGTEAFIEDLKEQLKDAKDAHEKAIENLRELASRTHHSMPLFDQKPKSANVEQPGDGEPEPSEPVEAEDNSWRDRDFIEFIKSKEIGGLGPKKIEALSEIAKTFGDFEDLRTKASLAHEHLSSVLPSGFGPKVTDEIEEAYLSIRWNEIAAKPSDPEPEPDPIDYESNDQGLEEPEAEPEAEPVASQVSASSFDLTDDLDSL
jgi:hypothetical protein